MPIRRLSQSLINKIAAGEVIERPASVVKELMENSVDAGATRIDVSIEAGGVELIRVADSGSGIAPEELPLAVAAHATSKIAEADDLFRVGTLGFRGEALASIAEVSRLLLRSRTADRQDGAEIEVVGGQASDVAPCGCPVGTTIEVRNLFYNTPVRRKFLRSTQTEFGHVSEAFSRIALANPQIHATLRHNGRSVFDLAGSQSWLERIALVFGRDLADNLIAVESSDGAVRLFGYVAQPTHSRSNNHMQYLFLNGRSIRDRSLQHALGEAYRGLLMTGRWPIAFLWLDMPPEQIDVNVHPTKMEVRFQDSSRLYSQLLSTLRAKFLTTDLTARVDSAQMDSARLASAGTPSASENDPASAHDDRHTDRLRQQVVDWAKGKLASFGPRSGEAAWSTGSRPAGPPAAHQSLELTQLSRSWTSDAAEPVDEEPLPGPIPELPPGGAGVPGAPGDATQAFGTRALKALQVHDRYLVAESAEGMLVIDQHALHERILYEHLRERILAGAVEAQNLLVPEPVDLAPAETAAVLEHRALLGQLGLKIEPFGGDTVLVTGYPAMLSNLSPVEVLHALVGQLMSGAKLPDRRDLLDELLHTIACKAAIKAGDRLAPEEIASLLAQRHLIGDPHHCPHGRPTALLFSREELDKQFKRI